MGFTDAVSRKDRAHIMQRLISLLRDTLEVLAAAPEAQIEYLKEIDRYDCGVAADELALEFDDAYQSVEQFRETNPKLYNRLEGLSESFTKMSDQSDTDVWRVEAFHFRSEWQVIREQALLCLAEIH